MLNTMDNITKIQFRRDTAANWSSNNPILALGEPAIEIASSGGIKYKVGDGVTAWNSLPYQSADFTGMVNQVSQLNTQVNASAESITEIKEQLQTATTNIESLNTAIEQLNAKESNNESFNNLENTVADIQTQLSAGRINYLTTAPTEDNLDGLIIVVLDEEPEVQYNGYIYLIAQNGVQNGQDDNA